MNILKQVTDEEFTLEQLYNMLNVYKSKLEDNTYYVLFIRPKVYKTIKDKLDKNLFCTIKITDVMPDNKTQAIIMTRQQYENLFGWIEQEVCMSEKPIILITEPEKQLIEKDKGENKDE